MSIVMYIIISLAIIGLTAQLIRDFTGFLFSILIMILIAFVIFIILSYVARNRMGGAGIGRTSSSPEARKYREAVKRSQEKYGKPNAQMNLSRNRRQQRKRDRPKRRWRRRRPTHLRLIKGKKSTDNKKNDRASF